MGRSAVVEQTCLNLWLRINSMPVCQHSRAPTLRVALLPVATGLNSSAAERWSQTLPIYKFSRRKHLVSLLAAKAPGAAVSRRLERRGRAVLCASSASAALLHSKYDTQILGLAVPALFSIILVRLACKLSPPGVFPRQVLSLGVFNLRRTPP